MAIVIGADSSTQSVKVEVRDAVTGEVLATARVAHPPTTPPCSEQDPDAWWLALIEAMNSALGVLSAEQRLDVVALSIGGQQHGMVTVDAAGIPIRLAKYGTIQNQLRKPMPWWQRKVLSGGRMRVEVSRWRRSRSPSWPGSKLTNRKTMRA